MKIAIIGLGWFGWPLAQKLAEKHEVVGTKTTSEGAASLKDERITALRLSLLPEAISDDIQMLRKAECLVLNIPPSRGREDGTAYYLSQMKSVLGIFHESALRHIVFISSTGVFSDGQEVCDEATVPSPDTGSGETLVAAEKYISGTFSHRVSIIRPGGLIGGARHPAKYMAGRKDVKGRLHPVNLIHRDDLITLTEWIIEHESAQRIFHGVVGRHPKKSEYYQDAAYRLGLALPEFDVNDQSTGKTISSKKTQEITHIQFKYDDPYQML